MKKVIFLLFLIVSSVFGGSASAEYANIFYRTVTVNANSCSSVVDTSTSSSTNALDDCFMESRLHNRPLGSLTNELCTITETQHYIQKPNDQYGNCVFDHYRISFASASWTCVQPSGGCPTGQTFDEQTCTCKCDPIPNFPVLLSPPVTQHSDCILTNPDIVLSDGLLGYISDVSWSSCENKCYGSTTPCPPHTAIVNGSCQIPPSPPCSGRTSTGFSSVSLDGSPLCYIHFYCDGTEIGRQQVSCDTSTPDSNSTGTGTGTGDSNSTGTGTGDSNSTGGSGDGDGTDTGDGGIGGGAGDLGDGGGSTSGDSNSTGTGTGTGDSNSTGTGTGTGTGAGDDEEPTLDFLSDAINDILNRYQIDYTKPCSSLQPISFNLYGKHITILSQPMIDLLPMSAIKAFVIFSFTLIGVLFAFKGGD